MPFSTKNILLIGAGKMGSALIASWDRGGWPLGSINVVENNDVQVKALAAKGVLCVSSLDAIAQEPDCVLLAVKPQSMDEILPGLAKRFGTAPLYLSIAAGKTISYFERHLSENAAVIRAMPNTPALIGEGITALVANGSTSNTQNELAEALLAGAGQTVWLESEAQMDAVTALSGSGPAYVFLFMDALIAAGVNLGLSKETATQLAVQTVKGSAKLAQKSDDSLEQLRKNVTSPGGTTEAALRVLMKDDALVKLVKDAATAAVKRAKELA